MWFLKCIMVMVLVSSMKVRAAPPLHSPVARPESPADKLEVFPANTQKASTDNPAVPQVNLLTLHEYVQNVEHTSGLKFVGNNEPQQKLNSEPTEKISSDRTQKPIQEHIHSEVLENTYNHSNVNEQKLKQEHAQQHNNSEEQTHTDKKNMEQEHAQMHDLVHIDKVDKTNLLKNTDNQQLRHNNVKQHESSQNQNTKLLHMQEFENGQKIDDIDLPQTFKKLPQKNENDHQNDPHVENEKVIKITAPQQITQPAFTDGTNKPQNNFEPEIKTIVNHSQTLEDISLEPIKPQTNQVPASNIQKINNPQTSVDLSEKLYLKSPFLNDKHSQTNATSDIHGSVELSQIPQFVPSRESPVYHATSPKQEPKPQDPKFEISTNLDNLHSPEGTKKETSGDITKHEQPITTGQRDSRAAADTPKRGRPASLKEHVNRVSSQQSEYDANKAQELLEHPEGYTQSFVFVPSTNKNAPPSYPNYANMFNTPNAPPFPLSPFNSYNNPYSQYPPQNFRYPYTDNILNIPSLPHLPNPLFPNEIPSYPNHDQLNSYTNPNFPILPNFPSNPYFSQPDTFQNLRNIDREAYYRGIFNNQAAASTAGDSGTGTRPGLLSRPQLTALLNMPSILTRLRGLLGNGLFSQRLHEFMNTESSTGTRTTDFNIPFPFNNNYENYIRDLENPSGNNRKQVNPSEKKVPDGNKFLGNLPIRNVYDADKIPTVVSHGPAASLDNTEMIYYQQSTDGELPEPVEGWSTVILPVERQMPTKKSKKGEKKAD